MVMGEVRAAPYVAVAGRISRGPGRLSNEQGDGEGMPVTAGECAGTRASSGVRGRCVRMGEGASIGREDHLPRLHERFRRVNKT